MNAPPQLAAALNWLLTHSLQAAALVVLVLSVQWLFRRHLTNRWRFALWWIVLARLLLPFSPQSAVSIFNVCHPAVHLRVAPATTSLNLAADLPPQRISSFTPPFFPLRENTDNTLTQPRTQTAEPRSRSHVPPTQVPTPVIPAPKPANPAWLFKDFLIPSLACSWLAGVLFLSAIVAFQTHRFHRQLETAPVAQAGSLLYRRLAVGKASPAHCPTIKLGVRSMGKDGEGCASPAPELVNLLDHCRREFGLPRQIELLETDAVQSPALFGLFRLRLLLPRGFASQFAPCELRYIFLHEIAHVKRGDLWLNWLVTALQILHWFNPLLWLGFARLRADRELACDELALLRAGDTAGTAYGETVVKLLEKLSRPSTIPGLVGILEDKKQMRRRILMIANFRRPGRWSALALLLILGLAAVALTDAQSNHPSQHTARIKVENDINDRDGLTASKPGPSYDHTVARGNNMALTFESQLRPDLTGTVTAKGGAPLPVAATVFIATASPKTGTSVFGPACYADCAKHAQTDAQGNFNITSLDPQLAFKILVVAKGYQPKYVSKVDPANGKPVKIELEPIASTAATPDHGLRSRIVNVVNARGQPVANAVVEMKGWKEINGDGIWSEMDPLAVTDENGNFLITEPEWNSMLSLTISARGFADKLIKHLPGDAIPPQITLTEGATLTGRVLNHGQPLTNVAVGVGRYVVGTGADGRFRLPNLPPNEDVWISTPMDSMNAGAAVALQKIHTGGDGEITDVGDLVAEPAHRVAGHIKLADGQPLPTNTCLVVFGEQAGDIAQVTPDASGYFELASVPTETISLSLFVQGYQLSAQNASRDEFVPFEIVGRVDSDRTNLVILLEKGVERRDFDNSGNYGFDPKQMAWRNQPLHGAEAGPDYSRIWIISGRVTDAKTGRPITQFTINQRAFQGTNGSYQVSLSKRVSEPYLHVEADGYLPQEVSFRRGATNIDLTVQKSKSFILKR